MIAAAVLLLLNVVRAAWLCDDAYVTFRTIDNWVHGYGLRWNVNERVQAYTHPLWMLFMSLLFLPFRAVPVTAWLGSLLAFGACIAILAKVFRANMLALVPALCALSLSSVFVEYSTSGLENPFTHVGIALLAREASRTDRHQKTDWQLGLVLGLMAVNRMDSVLFGLPLLALRVWQNRSWPRARTSLIAFALLPGLWAIFSVVYYGSPFPNTAFAKLGAGIPQRELIEQGLYYLFESVLAQPWSMVLLTVGFLTFPLLSRPWSALVVGGGLYVTYIVWIGGDFMQGRFLSGPVFMAALCVSAALADLPRQHALPMAGLALLAAMAFVVWPEFSADTTWRSEKPAPAYGQASLGNIVFSPRGIANERDVYVSGLGIGNLKRDHHIPYWPWFLSGRAERAKARDPASPKPRMVVWSVIGMFGYGAGPDVHVIDERALSDPFLARLPARYDPAWRPGHYDRVMPPGYLESAQKGTCMLTDRALCPGLERVFRVTRGPIWSWQRWRDMFTLWTTRFLTATEADRQRHPQISVLGIEELGPRLTPGTAFNAHYSVPRDGVQLELHKLRHHRRWWFGVDHNDGYEIQVRRNGRLIESHRVEADMGGGIIPMLIEFSEKAADEGYDAIRVLGRGGDGLYALAYASPEA
jgi:arabinofuranosyltransferase